jgi:mRNA-degrading endonuclease RelE of RelBE toxin-antitoxin system
MYGVHITEDALKYVNSLTEKSERLIKRKLEILKE